MNLIKRYGGSIHDECILSQMTRLNIIHMFQKANALFLGIFDESKKARIYLGTHAYKEGFPMYLFNAKQPLRKLLFHFFCALKYGQGTGVSGG